MTYGVDECRVCGKAMQPSGPEAMLQHLAGLKGRPTMTEKQWRAAGFKAAPTRRQMSMKHVGCCFDCKLVMGRRGVGQRRFIFPAVTIAVLFVILLFLIGSHYT